MSLLAHPERNVLLTGRANSMFADVAKVLAVRLGRRFCDVGAEVRKRRLLARSAIFAATPSESSLAGDVLRDCGTRRNLVACLDYESLCAVADIHKLLSRFYAVALIDGSEPTATDGESAADGLRDLPCELQLFWQGFQARQLARVITHCLYG